MSTSLISRAIDESFFDSEDETLVTWLGGAGVLINGRGTILLIDPLISLIERDGEQVAETGHRLKISLPIRAEQVSRADAVLYTHADDDHLGLPTAEALDGRLAPLFVGPPPVVERLINIGVEPTRTVAAVEGECIEIGQVRVEVTPALHDWKSPDHWRRGDCCGFVVRTADGTVWQPGDTRLIDELLEVRGVDVLFFDVACVPTHLGPAGSARLARTCGATDLIAYHYGTYDVPPGGPFGGDPDDCRQYAQGLSARFHLLNPGQVLRLPQPMSGSATVDDRP